MGDLPRLRKLSLAENRISTVTEVESLCSFPFLCELELLPNPIMNLPYYRAQVLHRLPSLRSLDEQPVSAEEKVKACVIYGADVEKRRAIFADLFKTLNNYNLSRGKSAELGGTHRVIWVTHMAI